jgi:hypothetical protein
VLYGMLHAFGTAPGLEVVVFAYFIGQVGNTIPIPGAVSGGLVGALLAFGVQADLAIVSVLAYRAIAIWLPAPIGLVALGALRRTIAAWGHEEATAASDVVEVAPELPVVQVVPPMPVVQVVPPVRATQEVLELPCERRSWRPREARVPITA